MTSPISIYAETLDLLSRSELLATKYGWEVKGVAQPASGEVALVLTDKGLSLSHRHGLPLRIDFLSGPLGYRAQQGVGKNDLLAKALGVNKGVRSVVDATAGLGSDSLMMRLLGLSVWSIEQSSVLYALLEDAQDRLRASSSRLQRVLEDWSLIMGDAVEVMGQWKEVQPDVVFLDPMFPEMDRSALNRKEMRALADTVGTGDREGLKKLWSTALNLGRRRVVLKQPSVLLSEPDLPPPTHIYKGRSIHYKVWVL